MTRLEALEALAREVELHAACHNTLPSHITEALRVLDALPPPPAPSGEVVEVVAHVSLNSERNAYIIIGMGAFTGAWVDPPTGRTIATIRARVPLPSISEVVGEVER